jgi:hypothetical protein
LNVAPQWGQNSAWTLIAFPQSLQTRRFFEKLESGAGDVGGGCDLFADSTFGSGLVCGLTYKVVSLPHFGHFTLLPDKNSSVANSMFTPQCSHGHFAIILFSSDNHRAA